MTEPAKGREKFMAKRKRAGLRTAVMLGLICAALGGRAWAAGTLVPMGTAVGIQMNTDGVLVVDTTDVETCDGGCASPARDAGIRPGDIITEISGRATGTAADLAEAAAELPEGPASVTVERGGETLRLDLTPVQSAEGPRLGLWLRDGVAGVGTLTYYDPETGRFGALGHGVTDSQTATMLPLSSGSVSPARIVDIQPGAAGCPGALSGLFDMSAPVGTIERNTLCGIFGTMDAAVDGGQALPVASDSEICAGPAYILSSVTDDGVSRYSVEISRGMAGAQGLMLNLRVTDETLLALTGGIVQGMSGSPIIQDGKLVGAVTHVLVSDASRGYGISIESMLAADAMDMAA